MLQLRPLRCLVVLVLAWALLSCQEEGPGTSDPGTSKATEGGPLIPPPDNVYYVRYEKDDEFTDGFQRLLLPEGSKPAVIDRVDLVGAEGLELIDVLYAGPERKYSAIQVVDGFPPSHPGFGPLEPIEGAIATSGELGLEIVIGLRVTRSGFASRDGIRIHYHVGKTAYFIDFAAGIAVCPSEMTDATCADEFQDSGS